MKVTIYFFLLFCCLVGIYSLNHSNQGAIDCAEYGLQKDVYYEGIIDKKWQDPSDHSYPMLRIAFDGKLFGLSRDLNFLADTGKFYRFIAVGDSVKKMQGSLNITVKRNGRTYIIALRPACN